MAFYRLFNVNPTDKEKLHQLGRTLCSSVDPTFSGMTFADFILHISRHIGLIRLSSVLTCIDILDFASVVVMS